MASRNSSRTQVKGEVTWGSNPFDLIVEVFKKLYPEKSCILYIEPIGPDHPVYKDEKGKGTTCFGVTYFTKGEPPHVIIDPRAPFSGCVGTLCHELAHVAAGKKAGHGAVFQKTLKKIEKAYFDLMNAVALKNGWLLVDIDQFGQLHPKDPIGKKKKRKNAKIKKKA